MKIYALICHKLDLTQFWPEVVSWRFEITTDDLNVGHLPFQKCVLLTMDFAVDKVKHPLPHRLCP